MFRKNLSIRKARSLLQTSYNWYKKERHTLDPSLRMQLENTMQLLDQAIQNNDKNSADQYAKSLELFNSNHIKRSFFASLAEIFFALVIALVIATVIRMMWFEPYEIPTGSMRPTFKEQDHLIVSKTTFGLNIPLLTDHFYFDPNLVQRTGTLIFSGDKLPIPDNDTKYFWLFPSVKRYVKRLMGKPGDTIYFYGGQIYAIDENDQELHEYLESPWLKKLEYLPFSTFEGQIEPAFAPDRVTLSQLIFRHFNMPVGRLLLNKNTLQGEILVGDHWIQDTPTAQEKTHDTLETYTDFWGMRNFGMARLLTLEQVKNFTDIDTDTLEKGVLYLEIRHNPGLSYPGPKILTSPYNRPFLYLTPYVSVIPLTEEHLDAIMDNMYTARFVVNRNYATRYSANGSFIGPRSPEFAGIPDGTYEFYEGKGYKIDWGGIAFELPKNHPLYRRDPSNIQKLYNMGIEFSTDYAPHSSNQGAFPFRYAYFRDGDLYLLGAPILKKEDPVLKSFAEKELKKQHDAPKDKPYVAFQDYGAPVTKEGKYDIPFLKTFGLKIPPKHYLVLGDNHAMSADSRYFGFVPEQNLQGTPSWIVWPPGNRWGVPHQPPYPWLTVPHIILWVVLGTGLLGWIVYTQIHRRKPIYHKLP
jgi:signal peptidase I